MCPFVVSSHCHCGALATFLQVGGEAGLTSWVALFGANVVPDVKVTSENTLDGSGMSLSVGSIIVDTIILAFALLLLFLFFFD